MSANMSPRLVVIMSSTRTAISLGHQPRLLKMGIQKSNDVAPPTRRGKLGMRRNEVWSRTAVGATRRQGSRQRCVRKRSGPRPRGRTIRSYRSDQLDAVEGTYERVRGPHLRFRPALCGGQVVLRAVGYASGHLMSDTARTRAVRFRRASRRLITVCQAERPIGI